MSHFLVTYLGEDYREYTDRSGMGVCVCVIKLMVKKQLK